MPTVTVLPLATYGPGTFTFPAISIPVGLGRVTLTVDITAAADPLPAFGLTTELSFDGGVTWTVGPGASRITSPKGLNRQALPNTTLGFTASLPNPRNHNRQIRGSVAVDGPVFVSVSVTL